MYDPLYTPYFIYFNVLSLTNNIVFILVIEQPIGVGPGGPTTPTEPEEHLYTVTIITGIIDGAGTKASVYITIYGSKGSSRETHLKKTGKAVFSQSQ